MSAPKRRLLDQLGSSPTFVAPGCHLTGDVEAAGAVIISGSVRGDGRIGGTLSMATGSQWDGEVHALAAVIAGSMSGRLVVEGKVEIGASAVVRADIVAGNIAIARGAVVDGEITVTGDEPIVRFEERRKPA